MVPCLEVLVSREGTSEEEVIIVLLDPVALLFHLVEVILDPEGQDLISEEVLAEVSVEALLLNVLSVADSMLVNAGELIQ